MTIAMTEAGLSEINAAQTVYSEDTMVNSGYSDCTLRITYTATMNSSKDLVFGDDGNDNTVTLTWKRSSQDYYDTLTDDSHVFSYGIDLTKQFSDGKGNFSKVEFLVQNKTDGYFVKAQLNQEEGIYYVTGHVSKEADATHFTPVTSEETQGKIIIKGLEDDTYTLTEVRTDNGYVMLKQGIEVVISQSETADHCTADVQSEHNLLTASATVDGKPVTMLEDNGSTNAAAPLTVVNTRGFDLPQTGDHGTWMYSIGGVFLMAVAASAMFFTLRKKKSEH